MYPVYPSFSQGVSAIAMDDLVGFLVVVLSWDSYFTNILQRASTAWWLFSKAHVATT
jgi:hypothetical protein